MPNISITNSGSPVETASWSALHPPAFFDVGFAPDESNKRAISNKPRLIAIKWAVKFTRSG